MGKHLADTFTVFTIKNSVKWPFVFSEHILRVASQICLNVSEGEDGNSFHLFTFRSQTSSLMISLWHRFQILRPHWKPGVVMMSTLSSLVTPEVVVMTSVGAVSDDNVGNMTTLGIQDVNEFRHTVWIFVVLPETSWILWMGRVVVMQILSSLAIVVTITSSVAGNN